MTAKTESTFEQVETIPENLFREPIDYLQAEHFRQRTICKFLEDVALEPRGVAAAKQAATVLDYLERDLPRHMADEEDDLFPMLRIRCRPEDNVEGLLHLLHEEHVREQELSAAMIDDLRCLSEGREVKREMDFLRAATALAGAQLRHLSWEDRLVLPLARKRFTPEDMETVGRAMAARRGVAYPN
jgi:hemerythrin-like domain-containing protein